VLTNCRVVAVSTLSDKELIISLLIDGNPIVPTSLSDRDFVACLCRP
jgi:hypothetical protein